MTLRDCRTKSWDVLARRKFVQSKNTFVWPYQSRKINEGAQGEKMKLNVSRIMFLTAECEENKNADVSKNSGKMF
jgi:hypothetical protein